MWDFNSSWFFYLAYPSGNSIIISAFFVSFSYLQDIPGVDVYETKPSNRIGNPIHIYYVNKVILNFLTQLLES